MITVVAVVVLAAAVVVAIVNFSNIGLNVFELGLPFLKECCLFTFGFMMACLYYRSSFSYFSLSVLHIITSLFLDPFIHVVHVPLPFRYRSVSFPIVYEVLVLKRVFIQLLNY